METFADYQEKAMQTLMYPGQGELIGLQYTILGLNGEAGELAEKVKKIMRDGNQIVTDQNREDLILEAGDVLWYLTAIAEELGTTIEEIAMRNVNKLSSRRDRNVLGGSGDNR